MFQYGRILWLPLLAALTLALSSCASVKPITADRPAEAAFQPELKKELSTLNIGVDTTAEDLARTLNQMVGKDLYRGSTKYNGLTADIVKSGPITVSAADDFLFLTLPIAMSLKYSFFETPEVSFNLKFKMNARITPDWKLHAELYYTGLSDLLAEETGIGPLTIKPRSIIDGITVPLQKTLSDLVSRKLNERYPLKAQVTKAWQAARQPILLDRNYSAWLKLEPRELSLFPLYARNNRFKLGIGMKTYAQLVVGPEPAPGPAIPLPELKLVNSVDRSFRIALNADLYYRDLVALASPLLLNKELGSDGNSIILKELEVYGNGDRLVVRVVATGTVDGEFYLTGKPVFNVKDNMFSVEDVDFDLSTRNVLVQTAGWLLHGTIREKIQEKLRMDMTPKMTQSLELARNAVARIKLVENVYLKGNIRDLKVNDLLVGRDRLSIQVETEGDSAILFQ